MQPSEPARSWSSQSAAVPHTVRQHNLSVVLHELEQGARSRSDVARSTGLTKATVSKLVVDLTDRGLVHETALVQGAAGRPATLLELSGDHVVSLAVAVEVDSLAVAAVDLLGRAHHVETVAFDNRGPTATRTVRRLAVLTDRLLDRLQHDGRAVAGATIAVPGLVRDGRVLVAPNLGWRSTDLAALIEPQLPSIGGTVVVENEANVAALAEAHHRLVRERSPDATTFLYVSAGVGVGAALVVDGVLFRGAHGFGGELGHLVVDPNGSRCACGQRGCLETIVGKQALLRMSGMRARRASPANAGSEADDAWIARLVAAATAGDRRVVDALDHVGTALASALATAVSLLDPASIVLGGFLTELAPWLARGIEADLAARVLGSRWVPYPVVPAVLGRRAVLVGAGRRGLHDVLADPLQVPVLPPTRRS